MGFLLNLVGLDNQPSSVVCIHVLAFLAVFTNFIGVLTFIINHIHFAKKKVHDVRVSQNPKKVSVLIPARNEEENILHGTKSILKQDYPNLEVVVLDDQSTDGTPRILEDLRKSFPEKLRVINGTELPSGWFGKPWACHNLAKSAKGDYFLFVDADVAFTDPQCISKLVTILESRETEIVTALPKQIIGTVGEMFILPGYLTHFFMINHSSELDNPKIKLVFGTNGQCTLFTRRIYEAINVHEIVKDSIIENIELGRQLKHNGIPYYYISGRELMTCRMYRSFWESWAGFKKNMISFFLVDFQVFAMPIGIFLSSLVPNALILGHLLGFCTLPSNDFWAFVLSQSMHMITSYLILRLHAESFLPELQLVIFPLQTIVSLFHIYDSLKAYLRGNLEWKGRVYSSKKKPILKLNAI